MAKKLQTPNQACRENDTAWQFIKNTCERTFEYVGAEKQTAEKLDFVIIFFLVQNSWLA